MPLYTAESLILRTYKLGEADRIVVFLTSDRGKRRGVAKGARRARSQFGGGLEPFTRAHLAYFERENRDLVRLSYVEPVASPLFSRSLDVLTVSSYFAELVDEWALEGDPSERLYRLGVSVVDALASQVPVVPLTRYFEYWLLRLQGVYPSIVACHRCQVALGDRGAVVIPHEGVFVCSECGSGDGGVDLLPKALAFLRVAATVPPGEIGQVVFAPDTARQLAAVHQQLIAMHLDKELRSVRVMRELGVLVPGAQRERADS